MNNMIADTSRARSSINQHKTIEPHPGRGIGGEVKNIDSNVLQKHHSGALAALERQKKEKRGAAQNSKKLINKSEVTQALNNILARQKQRSQSNNCTNQQAENNAALFPAYNPYAYHNQNDDDLCMDNLTILVNRLTSQIFAETVKVKNKTHTTDTQISINAEKTNITYYKDQVKKQQEANNKAGSAEDAQLSGDVTQAVISFFGALLDIFEIVGSLGAAAATAGAGLVANLTAGAAYTSAAVVDHEMKNEHDPTKLANLTKLHTQLSDLGLGASIAGAAFDITTLLMHAAAGVKLLGGLEKLIPTLKNALKTGVELGADAAVDTIKEALETALKDILSDAIKSGSKVSKNLAKTLTEDGIKNLVEETVKDTVKSAIKAATKEGGEFSAESITKEFVTKLIKSFAKKLAWRLLAQCRKLIIHRVLGGVTSGVIGVTESTFRLQLAGYMKIINKLIAKESMNETNIKSGRDAAKEDIVKMRTILQEQTAGFKATSQTLQSLTDLRANIALSMARS